MTVFVKMATTTLLPPEPVMVTKLHYILYQASWLLSCILIRCEWVCLQQWWLPAPVHQLWRFLQVWMQQWLLPTGWWEELYARYWKMCSLIVGIILWVTMQSLIPFPTTFMLGGLGEGALFIITMPPVFQHSLIKPFKETIMTSEIFVPLYNSLVIVSSAIYYRNSH